MGDLYATLDKVSVWLFGGAFVLLMGYGLVRLGAQSRDHEVLEVRKDLEQRLTQAERALAEMTAYAGVLGSRLPEGVSTKATFCLGEDGVIVDGPNFGCYPGTKQLTFDLQTEDVNGRMTRTAIRIP